MMSMVERVARAIVEQLRKEAERFQSYERLEDERTPDFPEEDCMPAANNGTYDGKIDAVALARAAIEAMRDGEMTDAMYFAACDETDSWTDPTDGECIKAVFKTALDAALNEQEAG